MYTVKFKCPNKVIANVLAILAENGEIQELINSKLEITGLLEGNQLEEATSVDFDEGEYPDHQVQLELS